MTSARKQPGFNRGNRTLRHRSNKLRSARTQLRYELLEPRHLLAGDLDAGVQALAASVSVQASAGSVQDVRTESPQGYDSSAGVQALAANAQDAQTRSPKGYDTSANPPSPGSSRLATSLASRSNHSPPSTALSHRASLARYRWPPANGSSNSPVTLRKTSASSPLPTRCSIQATTTSPSSPVWASTA